MLEQTDIELRKKAYEIIQRKGNDFSSKFENSDLKTLLHELDVYQAELEAQNEELRNKELSLILANEKNQKLFNEAPFPYLLLDNSLTILEANFLAHDFFDFTRSKKSTVLFSTYIKQGEMKKFLNWIVSNEYKNNYLELDLVNFNKNSNKFRLYLKDYKKEKDFIREKGKEVELKLFKAIDGVKEFEGTLVGLSEDNEIEVQTSKGLMKFPRKNVAVIRLMIKI